MNTVQKYHYHFCVNNNQKAWSGMVETDYVIKFGDNYKKLLDEIQHQLNIEGDFYISSLTLLHTEYVMDIE